MVSNTMPRTPCALRPIGVVTHLGLALFAALISATLVGGLLGLFDHRAASAFAAQGAGAATPPVSGRVAACPRLQAGVIIRRFHSRSAIHAYGQQSLSVTVRSDTALRR